MTEIGIIAVGGYNEMGRNMTAIRVDEDIIILDMGLRLDRVQIHEDVEIDKMHSLELINMGAIPDDTIMKDVNGNVRAIVCTHGHLDHIGAIPKLAHRYSAPIISTPYTTALIKHQIDSERKFGVKNNLISMKAGETYEITKDVSVEFINTQHSIIDTVFAVIHTPKGAIMYACDFKLDRTPTLGEAPDFNRLKSLGEEGVIALITESTNSGRSGKAPSEQIAHDLVKDVLLGTEESDVGMIITTFASHISRLNSIISFAKEMGRIPILLGRSMDRYMSTAKELGYVDLPGNVEIYGQRREVEKALEKVMRGGKNKYLPIVTGHQGEPGSILIRIANGDLPYIIEPGDKIVFSANVIPNPLTRANRYALETKLRMKGARIYDNVHVSGHAYREDHWELLRMVKPEHVIPAHGTIEMHAAYIEMAEDAGYVLGDTLHLLRNGEELYIEE
ncbi:putative hydrolase of the metallo-beta-lactamase superfamily [Methanomethylovorans hollandica DSM 15978]|jgi:ribonuclease J|uniref:Ribonuclease J n=1 Tax=Methanomethylovorans hollandica (strain DSM 15978 / NBRC 107637 / DMS1) TaxID=867904 RepID=L0KXJ9_METHD|nr:RNase J family beta-CASP ribonuclease [Methanomethylovorans hollandica]AGB49826.1 putative hydrolase of the metallo-beta-lactamase superfamily [Methanomethylovorans hollandica DSM 15978]